MKYEDYQQAKWLAIYGAYIALKSNEFILEPCRSFLENYKRKKHEA